MAQLRTQHLDKQFELYRYRAKTLLSGVDVPGNFLQMGGAKVIKGLTGGDVLDAEGKGINDGYHIVGNYNIIITANEKLRVSLDGDVEAWRRRLLLLEFNQPPPAKKIDRFAEKLVEEEGPAILAWGLRGFLRVSGHLGGLPGPCGAFSSRVTRTGPRLRGLPPIHGGNQRGVWLVGFFLQALFFFPLFFFLMCHRGTWDVPVWHMGMCLPGTWGICHRGTYPSPVWGHPTPRSDRSPRVLVPDPQPV
jgi:hypothetical protein